MADAVAASSPRPMEINAMAQHAILGPRHFSRLFIAETARPRTTFRRRAGALRETPLIGSGTLGERRWSGPAITVVGIDAPSVGEAVNAVLPYTRQMSRYASTSGCPSSD